MQKQKKLKSTNKFNILLPTLLFVGILAAGNIWLATYAAIYLMASNFTFGLLLLAASITLFWSSGALYITIPLHAYFSIKFSDDSSIAFVDLWHRRALRLIKKLPLRRSMTVSSTVCNLGLLRMCQGHYENAVELFLEAKTYLEKHPSAVRDLCFVVIENNRAVSFLRMGKYLEAEMIASDLLEICRNKRMQKDYAMLEAAPLAIIGAVHSRLEEYESAEEHYNQSLSKYLNSPVPKHYSKESFKQAIAFEYLGLAFVKLKTGRKQESLKDLRLAFEHLKDAPGQLNTLTIEPLNRLACQYMETGMLEQAEALIELAYEVGKRNPFHPDAIQTLATFERLLLESGRGNELLDMKSWLRPVSCRLLTAG